MSDDSFIREVNEEIRQDQARALWDRFGPAILGLAALVVIGTGAWVAWDHWQTSRANAAGDAFSQALKLARDGKNDEALAALKALEDGRLRRLSDSRAHALGHRSGRQGRLPRARSTRSTLWPPTAPFPMSIRDMARLRAAFLLVDTGTYADVAQRAEQLSADTNPLRASAREALGLSAWKEGKASDALKLFEQISNDDQAPQNARQRADADGRADPRLRRQVVMRR